MTWHKPEWPLKTRMTVLIKSDGSLAALLNDNEVYNTVVATDGEPRSKPHVAWAATNDAKANLFGNKGEQTDIQLHIVANNDAEAAQIYNELVRLFDGVKITGVADHTVVQGDFSLITSFPEEDLSGIRRICGYTVRTVRA
jgi:hypothetical protein